jgi:hypothetical protein
MGKNRFTCRHKNYNPQEGGEGSCFMNLKLKEKNACGELVIPIFLLICRSVGIAKSSD